MYVVYEGPRPAEEYRDPAIGSAVVFKRGDPVEIDDAVGETLVRRPNWKQVAAPRDAKAEAPPEPPLWSLGRTAVNKKAQALGIPEPEAMKDKAAVIAAIEKAQSEGATATTGAQGGEEGSETAGTPGADSDENPGGKRRGKGGDQ